MSTLLHMSFRVKNPERSAALYAELLNGTATDPGPVLRPAGVKAVTFGRGQHDPLADYIEFWPQDKHCRRIHCGAIRIATNLLVTSRLALTNHHQLAAIARETGARIGAKSAAPLVWCQWSMIMRGIFWNFSRRK